MPFRPRTCGRWTSQRDIPTYAPAASFGASDYASAEQLRMAIEYADADMYRQKSQRKARLTVS